MINCIQGLKQKLINLFSKSTNHFMAKQGYASWKKKSHLDWFNFRHVDLSIYGTDDVDVTSTVVKGSSMLVLMFSACVKSLLLSYKITDVPSR